MHEEGFTVDASGIHNKAPGPAYVSGDSTVHVNGTLNSTTTMDEHTHPGWDSRSSKEASAVVLSSIRNRQPGRDKMYQNARGWDNVVHVEASAGTGRVYTLQR